MVTTELIATIEFESTAAGKQRETICLFYFRGPRSHGTAQRACKNLAILKSSRALNLKQCCG